MPERLGRVVFRSDLDGSAPETQPKVAAADRAEKFNPSAPR